MRLPILIVLLLAPAPPEKPTFEAVCRKTDDNFRYVADDKGSSFHIISPSGISSASIKRKSGDWPSPLLIRFSGLRGLEGFGMVIGKVKLSGFLPAGEGKRIIRFNARGEGVTDPKLAVWTLTITRRDSTIEVLVETRADLSNTRDIGLSWIDFYRR